MQADSLPSEASGKPSKPVIVGQLLLTQDYPGNVRELINILDRARALEEDDFRKLIKEHREINRELLSSDGSNVAGVYPDNLEKAVRMHAKAVFKKYGGSLSAAREALGISVNTLKKYLADPVTP